MREFFKGWRRKVGCVALVMACLFMGEWVWSLRAPVPRQFVLDRGSWKLGTSFFRADHTVDRFYSKNSCVIWETLRADAPIMVQNIIAVWLNASDVNIPDLDLRSKAWKSHQVWNGFGVGDYHLNEGRFNLRIARVMLPYWSIVLPLTLLSAYLILWKPRKRSESQPGTPTENRQANGRHQPPDGSPRTMD